MELEKLRAIFQKDPNVAAQEAQSDVSANPPSAANTVLWPPDSSPVRKESPKKLIPGFYYVNGYLETTHSDQDIIVVPSVRKTGRPLKEKWKPSGALSALPHITLHRHLIGDGPGNVVVAALYLPKGCDVDEQHLEDVETALALGLAK